MNEFFILAVLGWIATALWRLGTVISKQVHQQFQSFPMIASAFCVNEKVLNALDLSLTFEGDYIGIILQNGVEMVRPEILGAYLSNGTDFVDACHGVMEAKRDAEGEWAIQRFQLNNVLNSWTKKTATAILFPIDDIREYLEITSYFGHSVSIFSRGWNLHVALSDREEPYVLPLRHLFTETVLDSEEEENVSEPSEEDDKVKEE